MANSPTSQLDPIVTTDILELMGAKDMADPERERLYKTMLETIQNRVIARLADKLPDEDLAAWEAIVESGDSTEHHAFLAEKQIDLDALFRQEALFYKIEMVELAKVANGGN